MEPKEQHPLSDQEKVGIVRDMLDFTYRNGLPLPQNIYTYWVYKIMAATHLWPHEAKVTQFDGESKEDFDIRRNAYLRGWIRGVARNAVGTGVQVKKQWGHDVSVTLVDPNGLWEIEYSVLREAVCEKKVTGKRVVPARVVPEHEEEEFEWVCDDKSLLED